MTNKKSCVICGDSFKPKTTAKTCSKNCSSILNNQRAREYHHKNLEYSREVKRKNSKKYRKNNPEQRLFLGAKQRAKEKDLKFNLVREDIFIPDKCPILDIKLETGTRHAPSLDRKDSTKGYTKDNVWVISRKANVMKNDATPEELERFCKWLLSIRS